MTLLTKRLESDAKALFAFYAYGALQDGTRLRWGFLFEKFLAEWGVQGEPSLYDFLSQKIETAEPIEFVLDRRRDGRIHGHGESSVSSKRSILMTLKC